MTTARVWKAKHRFLVNERETHVITNYTWHHALPSITNKPCEVHVCMQERPGPQSNEPYIMGRLWWCAQCTTCHYSNPWAHVSLYTPHVSFNHNFWGVGDIGIGLLFAIHFQNTIKSSIFVVSLGVWMMSVQAGWCPILVFHPMTRLAFCGWLCPLCSPWNLLGISMCKLVSYRLEMYQIKRI